MHISLIEMQTPRNTAWNEAASSNNEAFFPKPLLDQLKPSKENAQKVTLKHLQLYIQPGDQAGKVTCRDRTILTRRRQSALTL